MIFDHNFDFLPNFSVIWELKNQTFMFKRSPFFAADYISRYVIEKKYIQVSNCWKLFFVVSNALHIVQSPLPPFLQIFFVKKKRY